jgi:hypothetical protein
VTLFSVIPAFAFVIGIYNILIAYRNRAVPGALAFFGIVHGTQIYSFGNFYELNVSSLDQSIFWDNIQFLGTDVVLILLPIFIYNIIGTWNLKKLGILTPVIILIIVNQFIIWFYPNLVRSETEMIQTNIGLILKYKWEIWMNFYSISFLIY